MSGVMDMRWPEAIVKVLRDNGEPLHYHDIAQRIIDDGYRTNVGATPARTVSAQLSTTLRKKVVRVGRGVYALKSDAALAPAGAPTVNSAPEASATDDALEDAEEMGLINAFGMFWRRSEIDWSVRSPRLTGVQQSGSQEVDFGDQVGVYLLYDGNRVVYVGRVTHPRLGARLWEHTRDRLTGRWDRFSWFGVRGVQADGDLSPTPTAGIGLPTLIATMEALLIEGLEPPQNRRQGDGFSAVEFIQVPDPAIEERRRRDMLMDLVGRSPTPSAR